MYDKKHAYLPHQENSHAPYLAQLRNFSAWVIAVFLISMMVTSCSSFLTERGMGRVSGCNAANVSKLLAPATALGLFSAELKRSQIYEKISVNINHSNILVPTKQNLEMSSSTKNAKLFKKETWWNVVERCVRHKHFPRHFKDFLVAV